MAGRFLAASDIEDLTGLVRPSAQIDWLRSRGYRHEVRQDGKPVVMWAEVEARLVGVAKKRSSEPNWGTVK